MMNLTLSHESAALVTITLNGQPLGVPAGISVAAAIMREGSVCRTSVRGQPRSPLCGMGICMECRATVDGTPQARTCLLTVEAGMEILVP